MTPPWAALPSWAIQESPQTRREIYLAREKLLYLVDDTLSDSPEGLGLFRHLVSPAKRLERYEQLEGFGFETDLRGIPVVRLPLTLLNQQTKEGELSESQRTQMIAPFQQFAENHIRNPKLGLLLDSMTYETKDQAERPSNVPLWDVELHIQQIGATLRDLATAGAVLDPGDPAIAEVRALMGLSRPDAVVGAGMLDMEDGP